MAPTHSKKRGRRKETYGTQMTAIGCKRMMVDRDGMTAGRKREKIKYSGGR